MRSLCLLLLIAIAACRVFHDHGAAPDGGLDPELAPRLIAPASLSVVTQQAPTLRWVLGARGGAPVVELCRDRACAQPLPVATQLAGDQRSARPTAALPAGWVFWRVRATVGSQTAISATWQFWVGAGSASQPVDTSHGVILDVNGDGHADLLVGAGSGVVGYLYLGSATASAAGWSAPASGERIDLMIDDARSAGSLLSVASAGDVNGDGFADFLIGVQDADMFLGSVHLYLGSATPRAADWNGASPGRRIDLIGPDGFGSRFGRPLASAGDVNGDGYADFLVGAYDAGTSSGAAHLYLGSAAPDALGWSAAGSPARIDLSNPDDMFAEFGFAVAGAGDVNGDGFADFAIGAPSATSLRGAAHLYLGAAAPSAAAWNAVSSPSRLDLTEPSSANGQFGWALAVAGDVNGDGFADVLIGAAGNSGAAHLYLGSPSPSASAWNAATSPDRIDLRSPVSSGFGVAVACAGDVDGDGHADFVIGADIPGAAYLFLGDEQPTAAGWNGAAPTRRVNLANPDGQNSFFGEAVAGGGDVNGDGFADFTIGASGARSNTGAVHLYLGAAAPAAASWNGAAPAQRIDLPGADGPSAEYGASLASAAATGTSPRS